MGLGHFLPGPTKMQSKSKRRAGENGFLNRMTQMPSPEQLSHGCVKDKSRQVLCHVEAIRLVNCRCTYLNRNRLTACWIYGCHLHSHCSTSANGPPPASSSSIITDLDHQSPNLQMVFESLNAVSLKRVSQFSFQKYWVGFYFIQSVRAFI